MMFRAAPTWCSPSTSTDWNAMDVLIEIAFYGVFYVLFVMIATAIITNKDSPIYHSTRMKIVRASFIVLSPIFVPIYWLVLIAVGMWLSLRFVIQSLIEQIVDAME